MTVYRSIGTTARRVRNPQRRAESPETIGRATSAEAPASRDDEDRREPTDER